MDRPGANLQQLFAEEGSHAWDKAWDKGVTPWDAGVSQPALVDLLKSGKLPLPTTGRALVPGCGKAYDAIEIASILGLDTVAVDISPTAVEAAKKLVNSTPSAPKEKLILEVGDFFKLDDSKPFELIYDYTFFVALSPGRRQEWATKMGNLAKSGAYLITLIAPLQLPDDGRGPPFHVIPEHYDELLKAEWEKVFEGDPVNRTSSNTWLQKLVVWKKV